MPLFHPLLDTERLVCAHEAVESAVTILDGAIQIATRAVVGGAGIGGAGGGCRRRRSFRHVMLSMQSHAMGLYSESATVHTHSNSFESSQPRLVEFPYFRSAQYVHMRNIFRVQNIYIFQALLPYLA